MIEYTTEVRDEIKQAIENCLFMFNTMARVWPVQQNIDAATKSIMGEIKYHLELPDLPEGEGK